MSSRASIVTAIPMARAAGAAVLGTPWASPEFRHSIRARTVRQAGAVEGQLELARAGDHTARASDPRNSGDAQNVRRPPHSFQRSHDRAKVMPLIDPQPAEPDKGVNRRTRDLHDKTRLRIDEHGIASLFAAECRGRRFLLSRQRARCRKAIPEIGNGQGTTLDRSQRP